MKSSPRILVFVDVCAGVTLTILPPLSLSLSLSLSHILHWEVQNFGSPHDHFILCLNFPKQPISLSLSLLPLVPFLATRVTLCGGFSWFCFLFTFAGFFDPNSSFQTLHIIICFYWGSLIFCCLHLRDSS